MANSPIVSSSVMGYHIAYKERKGPDTTRAVKTPRTNVFPYINTAAEPAVITFEAFTRLKRDSKLFNSFDFMVAMEVAKSNGTIIADYPSYYNEYWDETVYVDSQGVYWRDNGEYEFVLLDIYTDKFIEQRFGEALLGDRTYYYDESLTGDARYNLGRPLTYKYDTYVHFTPEIDEAIEKLLSRIKELEKDLEDPTEEQKQDPTFVTRTTELVSTYRHNAVVQVLVGRIISELDPTRGSRYFNHYLRKGSPLHDELENNSDAYKRFSLFDHSVSGHLDITYLRSLASRDKSLADSPLSSIKIVYPGNR